ncbi:MAG TPA: zinc ribbon domain-containing protein [Vicinamibacterales bacterium]|nr:zinc ribbon domain-containing protein [Vicinamibacterales bacterium]
MPIFEYRCCTCANVFERLVLGEERLVCPSCGGATLERQLTSFAVSSAERSSRALSAARERYRRSKARAERRLYEADQVRQHLQEDYGFDMPGRLDKSST